uniref:MADF domain-containing protein n=1 Tax=Anopheles maculatus TaxID=74869 RepID=A0A182SA32_9DIPT
MGPTKITPEDQAFNINFVGEVKKHPCLFDSGNPDYKQQSLQDRAWLDVSSSVGESIDTCKKRWRNLRCCMTRYQKSVRDSSDQAANARRKPYYLYNHMQFVLPHLKAREESSAYEPDETLWAKAESESMSKHEEEEDDDMDPHELEAVDVPEEDHSQQIKDSILNSIKIVPIGQEQQTVADHHQQQEQNIIDHPHETNAANTTAYEIIAAPPLKQARLSNTQTSVGSVSPAGGSPLQTSGTDSKRDILAQRQFFTIQTANIPMSCYSTTPLTSQTLSHHQQQQQHHQHQQQTISQPQLQTQVPPPQFTIIPNTPAIASDADHNFFQSLVPDIQTMTMEQKRKLKIGILQLIDDILKT